MTDFYTKMVTLKTKNAALWNGSFGGEAAVYEGTDPMVLTYSRTKGKKPRHCCHKPSRHQDFNHNRHRFGSQRKLFRLRLRQTGQSVKE